MDGTLGLSVLHVTLLRNPPEEAPMCELWPWSRGCRAGAGGQPVLGPRAAHRRAG